MKNKKIIISLIAILLVALAIVIGILIYINNDGTAKKKKIAHELWGDEYCEYNGNHPYKKPSAQIDFVIQPFTNCKVCDETILLDSRHYMYKELCIDCSIELDRCVYCGKRLKK